MSVQTEKGNRKSLSVVGKQRALIFQPAEGLVSFQFLKESLAELTKARVEALKRQMEESEAGVAYESESFWRSKEDFIAWTKSKIFADGHAAIGKRRNITLRPAILEEYNILQVVSAK